MAGGEYGTRGVEPVRGEARRASVLTRGMDQTELALATEKEGVTPSHHAPLHVPRLRLARAG